MVAALPMLKRPSVAMDVKDGRAASKLLGRDRVVLVVSGTPRCGPSNSGTVVCTARPSAQMHLTTTERSLSSNRSTVSNTSCSATPSVRHARRKLLMFSICLNGSLLSLILRTEPRRMAFTSMHSICPSLSDSPKSPANATPVTASIHSWASCMASGSMNEPCPPRDILNCAAEKRNLTTTSHATEPRSAKSTDRRARAEQTDLCESRGALVWK
mmetsp:Transcript_2193/g.9499  ORF Transcript_2193/g.9499 Transcript_2193/m.9499 type:complete len:214 (-) Transcript_2193:42-683(-)